MTQAPEPTLFGQGFTVTSPGREDRPRRPLVCPFCPGSGAVSPPTKEQRPHRGDWAARCFDNPFPVAPLHEVVVDTRRHVERFDELSREEAVGAIGLAKSRMVHARANGGDVMYYRNDGELSGASIAHAHGHVVGFSRIPRLDVERMEFGPGCPLEESGNFRDMHTVGGFQTGQPLRSRFDGEQWVWPSQHGPSFEASNSETTAGFADALIHATKAVAESGGSSYNVFVHSFGADEDDAHWHAEVAPRRDVPGGLELGGDIWVRGASRKPKNKR